MVLSAEGANQSASGTCTDLAGNTSDPVAVNDINMDKTVPTLAPVVSPNPVLLNDSATASPNASDATSGIAASGCDAVVTSSVGAHSVTCTATDQAGNSASASANYTVNPVLCDGLVPTRVGTSGPDTITGTNGRDVIHGLGGNDSIRGRNGNDVICGGQGNDVLFSGGRQDRLLGENGNDTLNGEKANDALLGGAGDDTLNGNAGGDALDGGADSDTCNGGSGIDTGVNCETVTSIP